MAFSCIAYNVIQSLLITSWCEGALPFLLFSCLNMGNTKWTITRVYQWRVSLAQNQVELIEQEHAHS